MLMILKIITKKNKPKPGHLTEPSPKGQVWTKGSGRKFTVGTGYLSV